MTMIVIACLLCVAMPQEQELDLNEANRFTQKVRVIQRQLSNGAEGDLAVTKSQRKKLRAVCYEWMNTSEKKDQKLFDRLRKEINSTLLPSQIQWVDDELTLLRSIIGRDRIRVVIASAKQRGLSEEQVDALIDLQRDLQGQVDEAKASHRKRMIKIAENIEKKYKTIMEK